MKKYLFIVRPWNVDFFLELKKSLESENSEISFLFLTMHFEAQEALKLRNQDAVYLPEIMDNIVNPFSENVCDFDNWMITNHGFGINYLYDTERFKPAENSNEFVTKHFNVLFDLIDDGFHLVSLTMDHFIYILAGYINEYRKGKNFFIMPVGFPLNANLVFSNPWNLNSCTNILNSEEILEDYLSTIHLPPKEVIHYMKKEEIIVTNLIEKLNYRWQLYKRWQTTRKFKSTFNYLERIEKFPFFRKPIKIDSNLPEGLKFNNIIQKFGGKLFYYPLQFEPEMSILAYSPYFKSQLELIRLITMHLAVNDVLLLKENPKMIGLRDSSFYEEISKLTNVVWVDSNENSRTIIKSVFKVISITGTACIEAACMGVNSLLVGFPPFRNFIKTPLLSNSVLSDFRALLYLSYSENEIKQHFKESWEVYSNSLVLGDFIPKFDGENLKLDPVKNQVEQLKQIIL